MQHWTIRTRRTLLKDKWICLHADECELPSGDIISPYYVLDEKEWVQVVAVNSADEVLLTRQYRHAAGIISIELPCGIVEDAETPLAAAKRELFEETGHTALEWVPLPVLFANPARQTNRIHSFLARQLSSSGRQNLDAAEEITFDFVASDELDRKIETGKFSHALHIASYFLALRFLDVRRTRSAR